MERSSSAKEEGLDLVETVFSWTLKDVLNENLCKHMVVFYSFFNAHDQNTLTSKKMCEKLIKSIVHVVLKILHFIVFSDFVASILDWKMVFKASLCHSFTVVGKI